MVRRRPIFGTTSSRVCLTSPVGARELDQARRTSFFINLANISRLFPVSICEERYFIPKFRPKVQ